MSLVVEKLLQEMMENKNCMCDCREYKEIASTGRITKKCQGCSDYPGMFKNAVKKIEEEIVLKN